jgi:hypothetical protein
VYCGVICHCFREIGSLTFHIKMTNRKPLFYYAFTHVGSGHPHRPLCQDKLFINIIYKQCFIFMYVQIWKLLLLFGLTFISELREKWSKHKDCMLHMWRSSTVILNYKGDHITVFYLSAWLAFVKYIYMSTVQIAPWNFIVEMTVSNKVLSNINSYKCGKINPFCETLHSS